MFTGSLLTRRAMLAHSGRLIAAAPLFTIVGCNEFAGKEGRTGFSGATMGTRYQVTMVGKYNRAGLQAGVEKILDTINDRLSTYRPNSELSRFNEATETSWVEVSPELARVIASALDISRASGGAFDATIGPLVNLWGFGPDEPAVKSPGDERIGATLAGIGHHHLEVKAAGKIRKMRPEMHVDLSGIGKGHAVDEIADYLEQAGIDHFLVDIGGDMRAHRSSADKATWRIGIERPEIGPRTVHRLLNLGLGAVATSGDYRNFFESGGSVYSHIIDPRTGVPINHHLASVTVVAATAQEADAWSTALMVTGPDRGLELADSLGLSAFFIIRTGSRLIERPSREFRQFLVS